MSFFNNGLKAPGICDRCGFRYQLRQLRPDGNVPNSPLLVCRGCYDSLNPWIIIGQRNLIDAVALRNPRIDYGAINNRVTPPTGPTTDSTTVTVDSTDITSDEG